MINLKSYKRLSDENILNIMYYRALGYSNSQIAGKFECSSVNIGYHVNKIRQLSEEGKGEEVFWKIVANKTGIDMITLLKKLDLLKS